jgi:hypothetical protein
MEQIGAGWTLLGMKAAACGLVLVLHSLSQYSLSVWGLLIAGVSPITCSVLPWAWVFLYGSQVYLSLD